MDPFTDEIPWTKFDAFLILLHSMIVLVSNKTELNTSTYNVRINVHIAKNYLQGYDEDKYTPI